MKYTILKLAILFYLISASISQEIPPQNPVIGIFTQTYSNTTTSKSSYIAASYVKFIQMSGAQVVPIFSFAQTSDLMQMLKKVNGILFTGGDMDYDIKAVWTRNADTIFKYAIDQNKQGNPFPIIGICMGHQLLSYLTSEYNDTILTRVHGDNTGIVLPLNFVNEGYLFSTFNSIQKDKMVKGGGIMYYHHNWAVTMQTFDSNRYLKSFWNLVATSTTPFNERFVAAFEAKDYPFYGVQFHPQKNLFQWKIYTDRSTQGAEVVQIMSNRFIDIARKSKNRFQSALDFTKSSIYNYKTEPTTMSFTEVYVFNQIPKGVQDQLQM